METTRATERRRERHTRRLSQRALREAGHPKDVGAALGKARTTICHETSTRTNQIVQAAADLMIRMRQHPKVDAKAVRRALDEACDLEDLTAADDKTLVARGLYLIDREDTLEARENAAAKTGVSYWDALGAEGWCQIELMQIGIELEYRGIDLLELHAERARAAA